MSIEVTTRHLEISEKVQDFAKVKATKLKEEFGSIEFIKVVLDKDGSNYLVSFVVQGGQSTTVESTDQNFDIMAAITAAYEKAHTQLRKHTQKLHEVRAQEKE